MKLVSGFTIKHTPAITHYPKSSDVDGWFNPELHAELKRQEWEAERHLDEMGGCNH